MFEISVDKKDVVPLNKSVSFAPTVEGIPSQTSQDKSAKPNPPPKAGKGLYIVIMSVEKIGM